MDISEVELVYPVGSRLTLMELTGQSAFNPYLVDNGESTANCLFIRSLLVSAKVI